MALDPTKVLLGTSNADGIYIAPEGTAFPTNVTDAPGASWDSLGYLSEDAVKIGVSIDSEKITVWQSQAPVATVITGKELSLDFTLMEVSAQNVALYFGATPATEVAGEFDQDIDTNSAGDTYAILIDTKYGDNVVRYQFNRCQLSASGDIEIGKAAAQSFPVTLTALDDNGTLGTIRKGAVTGS
jgi:hypothetical protein